MDTNKSILDYDYELDENWNTRTIEYWECSEVISSEFYRIPLLDICHSEEDQTHASIPTSGRYFDPGTMPPVPKWLSDERFCFVQFESLESRLGQSKTKLLRTGDSQARMKASETIQPKCDSNSNENSEEYDNLWISSSQILFDNASDYVDMEESNYWIYDKIWKWFNLPPENRLNSSSGKEPRQHKSPSNGVIKDENGKRRSLTLFYILMFSCVLFHPFQARQFVYPKYEKQPKRVTSKKKRVKMSKSKNERGALFLIKVMPLKDTVKKHRLFKTQDLIDKRPNMVNAKALEAAKSDRMDKFWNQFWEIDTK